MRIVASGQGSQTANFKQQPGSALTVRGHFQIHLERHIPARAEMPYIGKKGKSHGGRRPYRQPALRLGPFEFKPCGDIEGNFAGPVINDGSQRPP